jgi:hypothetical protein
VPALLGAALLCSRFRHPMLVGLCTTGLTAVTSLVMDDVQMADQMGACLRISVHFGIPEADAYNDDGQYCRGSRV